VEQVIAEGKGLSPQVYPGGGTCSMKGLSRKNFSLAGRRLIYFSAASHSTLPKQFNYHYHSWLPSLILAEGIQVSLSEQPNTQHSRSWTS